MILTFFVFGPKADFLLNIPEKSKSVWVRLRNAFRNGDLRIAHIRPFYLLFHSHFLQEREVYNFFESKTQIKIFSLSLSQGSNSFLLLTSSTISSRMRRTRRLILWISIFSFISPSFSPLSPSLSNSKFAFASPIHVFVHVRTLFGSSFGRCLDLHSVGVRILK